MIKYLSMVPVALATVFLSAGLCLAEKKTALGTWDRKKRQWLYGILFGILSVCGTEFAVTLEGVSLNESTAAPLCAGLIFGAPAGIIAGVIGGVERYLATFWGAGYFGRYAGSLSILFAGLCAAGMRRFLFDDQRPSWYFGFMGGVIAEVMDMLLLLLTRTYDIRGAFYTVKFCAAPLTLMNALAVLFSLLAVSILEKDHRNRDKSREGLAQTFQKWLLACVSLAFLATSVFTYWVEDGIAGSQVRHTLRLNIEDVRQDIRSASDRNLLDLTHSVASILEWRTLDPLSASEELLGSLTLLYNVAEIDVINEEGIITATTRDSVLGYDMASGEQSAAFLALLNGTQEMVQSYQPTSFNPEISRKYAGVALKKGGFLQVGYDASRFQRDLLQQVTDSVANRHIGENGFLIVCDENWKVVSDSKEHTGPDPCISDYWLDVSTIPSFTEFRSEIEGVSYRCMYESAEGYYIVGVIPEEEASLTLDVSLYVSVFTEVIIFTALFVLIYLLIKKRIVDNMHRINRSLNRITEGDLDQQVDVRSNREFTSLSDDINATVQTLKHYIKEAEARIDAELALAKAIQKSALPSVFPPYPNRTEFAIWAGMRTAKEVGGDFYDFYMLGENRLAFLAADVSGKGIPAAMFMMTAKTLLKSLAETGLSVEQVLTEANQQLCENNDAGMFVTAWMGILDLESGTVAFGNAGHNPPLIRRADGSWEYLKSRPGLVLAGMEGIRYRKNEVQLRPGDLLYLYTDGVTEATDAGENLYGEDRLRHCLESLETQEPETICREILKDVDAFVGDAPQFDDITMVCLRYLGPERPVREVRELTVEASLEQLGAVTDFVERQLNEAGCPMRAVTQVNMAVDEIFSNIARYAYEGAAVAAEAGAGVAAVAGTAAEAGLGFAAEVGAETGTVTGATSGTGAVAGAAASTGSAAGTVTVQVEIAPGSAPENSSSAAITFLDHGRPFNPLEQDDPDVTLPVEQRKIGGLGIFLVKKTMDQVSYEYRDGKNRLRIVKNWS